MSKQRNIVKNYIVNIEAMKILTILKLMNGFRKRELKCIRVY